MTEEQILEIVRGYKRNLELNRITAIRMDPSRTFESLSREERLQHAHHLCDGIFYLKQHGGACFGKLNRHFASIQMCLSFAGMLTLEQLMEHNRPKQTESQEHDAPLSA